MFASFVLIELTSQPSLFQTTRERSAKSFQWLASGSWRLDVLSFRDDERLMPE